MAGEKLIQLTLQLPVSELAGVSALLEQVRRLLADGRQQAPAISTDSGSFDEARFQAMQQEEAQAAPAQAAQAAPAPVQEPIEAGVVYEAEGGSAAASAQPDTAAYPASDVLPAALPAAVELPAAASFRPMEQTQPEAPAAPVPVFTDQPKAPRHPGGEALSAEVPSAAPQPVTAEALSLAFRRDDRRYDSGFPLY